MNLEIMVLCILLGLVNLAFIGVLSWTFRRALTSLHQLKLMEMAVTASQTVSPNMGPAILQNLPGIAEPTSNPATSAANADFHKMMQRPVQASPFVIHETRRPQAPRAEES